MINLSKVQQENTKINVKIMNDYREHLKLLGRSNNTITNYLRDIAYFENTLKWPNFNQLTIEDIEYFVKTSQDKKNLGSTINRRLSSLKGLTKFMIKVYRRNLRRLKKDKKKNNIEIEKVRDQIEEFEEIINHDSVKSVKAQKKPFTFNELKLLLEKSKHNRYNILGMRNYLLLRLSAIGTGGRNTAIRQLTKQDLDCFTCDRKCEKCIPTIQLLRKGKTDKKNRKITVRIEKLTCQMLKDYITQLDENNLIFRSRIKKFLKPLGIKQMNNIVKNTCEIANIELKGRTYHSLRHTFVDLCLKNGTPYNHMVHQIDHEGKLGVTGVYEHFTAKDLEIYFIELGF